MDGTFYIALSLHPWDEAYLIVMNDSSGVFLDSICENFFEYFCICIHKRNWSEVLFVGTLCSLGDTVIVTS